MAGGELSTALGTYATATGNDSVAIGASSSDGGLANVVSFGSADNGANLKRRLIQVADGVNASDAATKAQLDAVGTVATAAQTLATGALQRSGGTLTGALDLGGNALTGLKSGAVSADSKDAVTGAQLYAALQSGATNVGSGGASGSGAVQSAVGGSSASGSGAVALGLKQTAKGDGAVAIGDPNTATGNGAVAIGADNTATGKGAVALGAGNTANGDGAVALGQGASASRAGQIALGGKGSSVTLGDVAASTAAQSGPTDVATVDAAGTLGRDTTIRPALAALQSAAADQARLNAATQALDAQQNARLDGLDARIGGLDRQVALNNRRSAGGIAAAMALGGTILPADARVAVSFNLATYRGEQGFSATGVVRATEHVYVSAGYAGSSVKGSSGGRVGMTLAW